MNSKKTALRQIPAKVSDNEAQNRLELYKIMYTKYIGQIRLELDSADHADTIFQEAFVVLLEKLKVDGCQVTVANNNRYFEATGTLMQQIIHNILLNIDVSAHYLIRHLKKNDCKATERLSKVLLSSQNQRYAKHLVGTLSIRSLDHQDFLQESLIILLQNIENNRFNLEPGSSNDVDIKKIFRYFREIVYRQIHKVYHDDKKITGPVENTGVTDFHTSIPNKEDRFELAVFQCFKSLDLTSQKMLKHLFIDGLSPKEVAKKMKHPRFPNTKDIVDHKLDCLQKLKLLTSEKLREMDQKSFDMYLEVSKWALKNLGEPCRTILTNILPPLQKSYREIIGILKNSKIGEKEFLQTEDQVKKRKYKCMIQLQDLIWQKLLTQTN